MHLNDPQLQTIIATTRRQYDENAVQYALKTDKLEFFPGLQEELDNFHRMLPPGPVLDLGCGAGRDTRHLTSLCRKVVSADLSLELLKITRGGTRTNVVQLNLLTLPFHDGAFAGVWVSGGLLHLPSAAHPHAFSEIYRVLNAGGATAISLREGETEGWHRGERMDQDRWFTLRRPDHVTRELVSAGFNAATWTYCGRRNWFIVEAVKNEVPTRPDEVLAGSA
ncbi:class I SAM-dependent methyltransferase [Lentzea albida]|uniref:Methyltransferase domain-containing protein n=1 Tax=Lentzea albida TaxID=65499 RepID=A0A1H9AIL3_9PSEU|nr:class I SAM-dependent methyltransferase [Lentzea albida]SEP76321.1 Methyltransferase domain-containing protein [Lentzea albida]